MHSSSTIEHAFYSRSFHHSIHPHPSSNVLDTGTILSYFVGKSTYAALILWFCSHFTKNRFAPKTCFSLSMRLVAAAIIFLLTATRDEQLFRALAEAAQNVVDKKGHLE